MKNSTKMKAESNSSKKPKIKSSKDNNMSENKKLINQKKDKETKSNQNKPNIDLNSKKITKRVKTPKLNKRIRLNINKEKSIDIKEQYSLYKKELQTLRDEEEKIKELRNKLRIQYDNDNNNNKKILYTNKKMRNRKNKGYPVLL